MPNQDRLFIITYKDCNFNLFTILHCCGNLSKINLYTKSYQQKQYQILGVLRNIFFLSWTAWILSLPLLTLLHLHKKNPNENILFLISSRRLLLIFIYPINLVSRCFQKKKKTDVKGSFFLCLHTIPKYLFFYFFWCIIDFCL